MVLMNEVLTLQEELKEVEAHIRELDLDGYRVNEELLARLERLKVELSLEQTK
jgi:hypothetical protein